jgi:hypothetical protein
MKEIITKSLEAIFDNTQRIHGKSDALDWQKIALYKGADYTTQLIKQFVVWTLRFCEYDISNNTFLVMTETHVWDEMSIDLAFNYWYNNVYKK